MSAVPAGSRLRSVAVAGASIDILEAADVDAELDRAVVEGRPPPYGRVLWPSAVALAERLAREDVRGVRVLELGAGCGLVSLACAARGARVMATDVDERALADIEAAARMAGHAIETARFDVLSDAPLPEANIVCAADLLYETHLARGLARRALQAKAMGARVFVGDPGRVSRALFVGKLADVGIAAVFEPSATADDTAIVNGTAVAVAVI